MNQATDHLPGFWRFAWLFWMQPITLHRLLRSLGVEPRESFQKLLRGRRSPHEAWWLRRSAQILLVLTPGATLVLTGIAGAFGLPVSWRGVARGVAEGVAGGVALMALGVPLGVTLGAASGAFLGAFFGLLRGGALAGGGVLALEACVLLVAGGVALDVGFGMTIGGPRTLARIASLLRLPVFAVELTIGAAARYWNAWTGRSTLGWTPVLYHELSYLPYPFLEGHLLAEADAEPALTRRVLEACYIARGQSRTGRKVEARLRARELARLARANDFQAIQELNGFWLPGVQGADGTLLSFSEAGRYMAAARAAFNPHRRLAHLQGFEKQLRAIENQLRSKRDAFTQPFDEPLQALREAGEHVRAEAEVSAAGLIPNPFRAGSPLSGEEGPELFRGRETTLRDVEEILADPSRAVSLLLLAPRRSGKTSLLKMMPVMLPDTVCVYFDLQAHPAGSVAAFWKNLAAQAIIQAKQQRRIDLPRLPDGPAMEAAAVWLEQLDQLPDGRRVLIAIDEFERLQDLYPGNRQEFLQLMGLFRATIQHRRGVRLLVSGAAPFDELDRVWDDHFISARQIKLPFLDLPTAVGLLTAPAPDFPPGTIPEEVAREVHQRTGGQPYLLQIFGGLMVTRLNDDEKRKTATVADVKASEGRAMEWAESYLRDMYKSAPESSREALDHLAQGQAVALAPADRRWLTQRYLLTPENRLAIPLFGAWIEHHAFV